ncbi:major facilitator superfamily domain-containing protein [Naematelia encephala]|uniref:Major facilitator superfamily domain-containing protein n=1 Tax=Naematelia encephala TaxID=71784 RepID=A0A1Y2ATD2_9TREE|nr:major facilitator superfamily domain-containing protein [Naematelia encephala]
MSVEEEKDVVVASETVPVVTLDGEAETGLIAWTREEERALVRKFDWRITPFMVITFIFNQVDRSIIANARLKGLQADLGMTDVDYATSISILFIGYISMAAPGTLCLHSIKSPKWFFLFVISIWGAISACTGAVQNSAQIIGCRFCLGFAEATLYPGAVYYLSRFYTAKEIGMRISLLNIGTNLSSGIGSLIAAGILDRMQGLHGLSAWRWLFIIEGGVTIALGLLAPILLFDYPAESKALSEREGYIAQARLIAERGVAENAGDDKTMSAAWQGFKLALADPVTYCFFLAYFFFIDALGYQIYQPSIIKSFGFSTTVTLVMVFPTACMQTLSVLVIAYFSDRLQKRWIFTVGSLAATLIGYIIFMATSVSAIGPRYFALFICSIGFSTGPIILAWVTQSTVYPPAKRAATIGLVNGFANLGQIPSSYYFQGIWAPAYRISMGIETVMLFMAAFFLTILMLVLRRRNQAMDRGEKDMIIPSEAALVVGEEAIRTNDAGEREEHVRKAWRYAL